MLVNIPIVLFVTTAATVVSANNHTCNIRVRSTNIKTGTCVATALGHPDVCVDPKSGAPFGTCHAPRPNLCFSPSYCALWNMYAKVNCSRPVDTTRVERGACENNRCVFGNQSQPAPECQQCNVIITGLVRNEVGVCLNGNVCRVGYRRTPTRCAAGGSCILSYRNNKYLPGRCVRHRRKSVCRSQNFIDPFSTVCSKFSVSDYAT